MTTVETRHLAAVICLSEKELARTDWHGRAGALRALLTEAIPYLRDLLAETNPIENEVAHG